MASPRAKRLSFRTTGLIVSLGVFLIACGVLGLVMVWNRPAGAGPIAAKPQAVMPQAPRSLTELGLQNAGKARVQFVAKDDPQRVTGFLEWESLEPTGPGKATISQPRAEVYLRDGRTVQVRAATGTVAYPPGQPMQPESGTFDGGVTVELLERPPNEQQPGLPIIRAFTPTLAFSGALSELAAQGPIRVSGEQFEFSGRGMRVVGNEVQSRIELLEIDAADYFWMAQGAGASGERPQPAHPPEIATGEPAAPATDPAGPGREVFYHAALGGKVEITRRAMTLTAERVQAWAHLIDNALPAGALGQKDAGTPSEAADREQPAREARATRPPPTRSEPIPGEPPSLFAHLDDPELVAATWSGPLTMAPMAFKPPELAHDAIAISCVGGEGQTLKVVDDELGASASADGLTYSATRRQVTVSGTSAPAQLALRDAGSLEIREGWLNLATGIGGARGGGKLQGPGTGSEDPRRITWTKDAEFAMTTRGGSIGDRPKEATFRGDVQAQERGSMVRADSARAIFGGFESPDGSLEGQLVRIETRGSVRASDAKDGSMSGDEMDVHFEPSHTGKSADPRQVTARGSVVAQRDGWRLVCDELDSTLDRDERNDVIVTLASAKGNATVTGRGVEAKADHVAADVQRQIVDFLGQPVTLARDGGVITGTQMRLEGLREELFVFGAGALDVERQEEAGGIHKVHAAWQKSMQFNNLEGKAECAGGVEVVSTPSPLEEESLRAERVLLSFTPGHGLAELTSPDQQDETVAMTRATDRRLLLAEAIGESEEREGGAKATIESKRFAAAVAADVAAPAGSRTVERLIYAEGDRLIADDVERFISVPGAGRLLIDDRRAGPAPATDLPAAKGPIPADFSGARGTSLFRWNDQLRFTRDDGVLSLRGAVRILHRDAPDAKVMSIDADSATARIRTADSTGGEPLSSGKQAELLSATCDGSVVAQLDGRRLTTDQIAFNALTGVLEAAALGDGRTILTQPGSPTPVLARKLIWDTRKDQWRVVDPAPVVVPR